MGRVCQVALVPIVLLGLIRTGAFLLYAFLHLPAEFETFNLEAKMVLLADRVQAGASLYPAWENYPHVSNFFSPLYFIVVGLVGRALRSDLHGLFLIGRAVTFGSAIVTTLAVTEYLRRKYDWEAALVGATLAFGTAPMYGFAVMARPDFMAEMLGVIGFFLSGLRSRRGCALGCVALVAAVMTKQTAVGFVLAASSALILEGRRKRALVVLATSALAVLVIIGTVTLFVEPRFARDLLGESRTPWHLGTWNSVVERMCRWSPDAFVFAVIGVVLWSMRQTRDLRSLALAFWIVGMALGTSAKRGADVNYFMTFRVIEMLAAGTLWHAAGTANTNRGITAVVVTGFVAMISLLTSTQTAFELGGQTWNSGLLVHNPMGRISERTLRRYVELASNPNFKMLSDAGIFDAYQRDRAVFGDPWLFHMLAETGQLNLETLERRIEAEDYELVVTTADLNHPLYLNYPFGLPKPLVERVRAHYVLSGSENGLYLYKRRGRAGSATRGREL